MLTIAEYTEGPMDTVSSKTDTVTGILAKLRVSDYAVYIEVNESWIFRGIGTEAIGNIYNQHRAT